MQGGGGAAVTSHLEVPGPEPAAVPGDRRNSTSVLAASASLLVARTAAENTVMLWRSLGSGPTISMLGTAISSGIWWRAMSASPFTTVSPTRYIPAELSSGIYRLGDAETLEVEYFAASRFWEAGPGSQTT